MKHGGGGRRKAGRRKRRKERQQGRQREEEEEKQVEKGGNIEERKRMYREGKKGEEELVLKTKQKYFKMRMTKMNKLVIWRVKKKWNKRNHNTKILTITEKNESRKEKRTR